MSLLYVISLLILMLMIMLDTFSECKITCHCGKTFKNTIFGASIQFDYHYIKVHILKLI